MRPWGASILCGLLLLLVGVACAPAAGPPQPTAPAPKPTTAPPAPAQPSAAPVAQPSAAPVAQPTALEKPAAAPSSSQALVNAARAEGKLVIYNGTTRAWLDLAVGEFTKKYGIQADFTRKSGPEITALVDGERRAGKVRADVLGHGDAAQGTLWGQQGVLVKYEPESAGLLLPEARDPGGFWVSQYTDDDAIDLLVAERKILVPTLTHRRSEAIEAYVRAGSHPSIVEKMKRVQEAYYDSFRKLHRAGVKMACGTDAGFEPTAGRSAIELGIYVQLGMTPMEAIQTATRNAAEAIGRAEELGTLEPGKQADILAVHGNPLDDIHILEDQSNVKLVIRNGDVVVDRRDSAPVQ